MLQRLKGAIDSIDSRLSEEQAKHNNGPARSGSTRRPRNISSLARKDDETPAEPGPDPTEFDVVFSESSGVPSRSDTPDTPIQSGEGSKKRSADQKDAPPRSSSADASANAASELPTDVRVKLRRLEKLEAKFQELLRSYRIAHPKAKLVDPFETALRENTPLTSISDPVAFVEYLNQTNTKNSILVEELKRISLERDSLQLKLKTASEASGRVQESSVGDTLKHSGSGAKSNADENFFSYDDELPRLQSELRSREDDIEKLRLEVQSLKKDLAVTRESTTGMATSLEEATKELSILRENKANIDEVAQERITTLEKANVNLESKLETSEKSLRESQTKSPASSHHPELEAECDRLKAKLADAQEAANNHRLRAENLQSELAPKSLAVDEHGAVKERATPSHATAPDWLKDYEKFLADETTTFREALTVFLDQRTQPSASSEKPPSIKPQDTDKPAASSGPTGGSSKKSKKKSKKGKPSAVTSGASATPTANTSNVEGQVSGEPVTPAEDATKIQLRFLQIVTEKLDKELSQFAAIGRTRTTEDDNVKAELETTKTSLAGLRQKLKDQDDLKEEIDSLRDELVNIGSELVDAKEDLKSEKSKKLEAERKFEELETQGKDGGRNVDNKADAVARETLESKASMLERELAAAQSLASTRYKDLTDLKTTLQKTQPELSSLRTEVSTLRKLKSDLDSKNKELRNIESRAEELKSEASNLKSKLSDKEQEVKVLNDKIQQESNLRLKVEESLRAMESKSSRAEQERKSSQETAERAARDVRKLQDATKGYRTKIQELEALVSRLNKDSDQLREEVNIKAAQSESAQNLISSMRDQTSEIGMQMKELRDRGENLEEELADAHRLLGERSREGDMMRRLLADIEGTADAKVREMKIQLEAAVEERDRAEDEASTIGKKRARELETLKSKSRDAERNLRRALDEKDDLERAEKDLRRQKDDFQLQSEQSARETNDIKQAMNQLREALDDSERQVQMLDQQKVDLKSATSEMQARLEKLQKANRTLNEDLKALHSLNKTKALESETLSSRNSTDSATSRPNLAVLNGSKGRASPNSNSDATGQLDFVYLKNVLLQFLEQKDKGHQKQLIPVLGMLLHFDRKDEQKWMSAISTK